MGFLARPRHARQLWINDVARIHDLFLVPAPVLALFPDATRIDGMFHAAKRPVALLTDAVRSADLLRATRRPAAVLLDAVAARDLLHAVRRASVLLPDVTDVKDLLEAQGRIALLLADSVRTSEAFFRLNRGFKILDSVSVLDGIETRAVHSVLFLDSARPADLLNARSVSVIFADGVKAADTASCIRSLLLPLLAVIATRRPKIAYKSLLLPDSAKLVGALNAIKARVLLLVDTVKLADVFSARLSSLLLHDRIDISDLLNARPVALLLADRIGVTDSAGSIKTQALLLADTARLVDALSTSQPAALLDTVRLSDAFGAKQIAVLFGDTASVTDMPGSVKVLSPLFFTLIKRVPKFARKGLTLEDSVRPADVSNYIKTLSPLLFTLVRRASKLTYRSVALSDRTKIADAFSARQIATFFTDSAGVIDAASHTKLPSPLLLTLARPARFRPVYKSLVLPDATTVRDVITAQKVTVVLAPDAARVTDTLSYTKRSVLLADRARIADIIPHLAYTDVLYYGPSASAAYTMARIPDRITIRDALTAKNLAVLFDDTAGVPDWFGTRLPVTAVFKDSASIRDTFTAQSRTVLPADGVTVRDAFIAQKS